MSLNTTCYFETIDEEKINNCLSHWISHYPEGGMFALVSEHNIDAVEQLQQASKQTHCPVIGGVFPGLIHNDKLQSHGIILIGFKTMPAYRITSLADSHSILDALAPDIVLSEFLNTKNDNESLLLIFDGMVGNISTIIDTLYRHTGDTVNYMGANAGSETFQPTNCLFDTDRFTQNAVLSVLIKNHQGAILEHCYSDPESRISATSSRGNHVTSIDWSPAFDVYKKLAAEHYGIEVTDENFYEHAVHFPLGILRLDGEMLVRIPVAKEADGSIFCVGEVPENAMLTLLQAIPPCSEDTVNTLASQIGQRSESNIVCFYCAGRRMHLGDAAADEISLLHSKLPGKNFIGALSLGEIAGSKKGGYPLFHNAALVNIPWD